MRLSLLMGQPPSVVMGWPASDVALLGQYLSREPAPSEKAEYGLAYLACMYANTHRGKGDASKPLDSFLMFRKAWPRKGGRYSDSDMEMLDSIDRL